ncbi:MAG: type I-E CRISPR-associated protein Cas7/Cse4/CasC [Candidatus Methanomethylophilaceae archaeon]|nr:type I-E CRISPR-associated protein Cas7/Cse4/CasC [Candidatus Methanomethylophilaceae archaeon]
MFVELHLIQNFAPHCLNRDETNSPKDCEFGGYRRARISSQCLKRAIRTSPVFMQELDSEIGVRTKLTMKLLKERFLAEGRSEEDVNTILEGFVPLTIGALDKGNKTKTLVFLSNREFDVIHDTLKDNWEALVGKIDGKKNVGLEEELKKLVNQCKFGDLSPDIALFGRMMAERPAINVDAAAQVAHAISTNRANMEMDFFTAIDDLQTDSEMGAGMMGTVEFNSSCFYRYSLVDVNQLMKNLKNDRGLLTRTVKAFIKASVSAIPTGKQTSMAAHNPPSMALVVLREKGQPISLTNAFAKPVAVFGSEDKDLATESISRLVKHYADVGKMYGTDGVGFAGLCMIGDLDKDTLSSAGVKEYGNMDQMVAELLEAFNASIADAA